jgi:hypothetical protein
MGDTLALVAPSLPLLPSGHVHYQTGKRVLESFGFHLKEGRTIHLQRWWSAGTPEDVGELSRRSPEEQIAGQVARLLEAGATARESHPERWLEVEYRRLCHDSVGQVERIAEWVGAPGPRFATPPGPFRPSVQDVEPAVLDRLAGFLEAAGVR